MSNYPRFLIPFTATYMVLAAVFAALMGNSEFVFYIVVMLVLIGVFVWLHRRIRLGAGSFGRFPFGASSTWRADWFRFRRPGRSRGSSMCFTTCGSCPGW